MIPPKDWAMVEACAAEGRHRHSHSGHREAHDHGHDVFYTQDAGATWKRLATGVEQFHWAAKPGGDERRVVLVRRLPGAEEGPAGHHPKEVLATDDFMASQAALIGPAAGAGGGPAAALRVSVHHNFAFAAVPEAPSREPAAASVGPLQLWFSERDRCGQH